MENSVQKLLVEKRFRYPRDILIPAICLSLVFLPYLFFVLRYAVNVPNADDFDISLGFLLDFLSPSSLERRFTLLLQKHGEHYLVFARVVTLAFYSLFGELNFRHLIFFGNLALPLSLSILYQSFPCSARWKVVWFLPAALILLQPKYVESILWSSGGLQHLWAMPLSLATLVFAVLYPNLSQIYLVILVALTLLCQGNGVICPLLLSVLYGTQRHYAKALAWGAVFISCALLFHVGSLESIASSSAPSLTPLKVFLYLCSFLGCGFAPTYSISIILGLILIGCTLFLLKQNSLRTSPALTLILLFLIITGALNALVRLKFGEHYAFRQSRYTFPSLATFAVIYLLMMAHVQGRKRSVYLATSLIVTTIGFAWSYISYQDQFILRNELLTESVLRWEVAGTDLEYPNQMRARSLLHSAVAKGMYRFPDVSLDDWATIPIPPTSDERILSGSRKTHCKMEHFLIGKEFFLFSGYAYSRTVSNQERFLRITDETGRYDYPIIPRIRPEIKRASHLRDSGFLVIGRRDLVERDNKKIQIGFRENNDVLLCEPKKLFDREEE